MLNKVRKILTKNISKLVIFELLFKLITLYIVTPSFIGLFKIIMKITGYNYITLENVISFIFNPITFILLIILLILIGIYSIFDIGVILILLDASYQDKKVELKDVIKVSLKRSISIFKPCNLGYLILVLFIIPILNIGITSGVITAIKIPSFIMEFIYDNAILTTIFVIFILFLTIILFKRIYIFHYFFLEEKNYKEAKELSINLSKKNITKDILNIILTELIIYLLFIIFIFIGVILILIISKLLKFLTIIESIIIAIIVIFLVASIIVFSILNISLVYSCISVLYYKHKTNIKEKIKHVSLKEANKLKISKKIKILLIIVFILLVITESIYNYGLIKGKYSFNVEYVRVTEVTAHRGASVNNPENTMSAFKEAKRLGAKWVELDIQQTKDRQIIVSHDTNFSRVTGVDLNTWDATYEDISKLDAGSFKGEQFAGEKVPLLEDVINWAKENDMKLNIEIKPTGYEENFEQQVIDLIKDKNFQDDCFVTSQKYEVLENIKNIDSNIKTAYVMSVAIGDITTLDKADYYSIEASNITKSMVNDVHNKGKYIFAWTVNDEETINEMIDLSVDNIITDNIELANKTIFESKSSDILNILIKFINKYFG